MKNNEGLEKNVYDERALSLPYDTQAIIAGLYGNSFVFKKHQKDSKFQ
ncbi:MAG: hypothetical protein WAL81_00920 [Methanobacterium sp.]